MQRLPTFLKNSNEWGRQFDCDTKCHRKVTSWLLEKAKPDFFGINLAVAASIGGQKIDHWLVEQMDS
jgi:hypothetical protein